jgi:hypothetical protein
VFQDIIKLQLPHVLLAGLVLLHVQLLQMLLLPKVHAHLHMSSILLHLELLVQHVLPLPQLLQIV